MIWAEGIEYGSIATQAIILHNTSDSDSRVKLYTKLFAIKTRTERRTIKEETMNVHIIFGLVCMLFSNVCADEKCDNANCLNTCKYAHLNGTCDAAGQCQCSFGHSCSTMANTCDVACKILNMEGECDENDQCICSATPEWCNPIDCQESCQDDPRSASCIIVEAVGCVEYGPVTFCQCLCYTWEYLGRTSAKQWSTLRKTGPSTQNYIEVLRIRK